MLQTGKIIKVLTGVTICTLFTAGFTMQETPEPNAKVANEVQAVTQHQMQVSNETSKYVKLTEKVKEEQRVKAEEEARIKAEEEAKRKAEEEAEAKRKAEEEAEAKRKAEEAEAQAQAQSQVQAVTPVAGEQELLAALIFCEAGNQPYEGQVAVGAVVMNRVRSGAYPNSISSVIYQSGQFGPAMTGWLDSVLYSGGYTQTAYQAAGDALAGVNPVGDCLYFGNGDWGLQIGDHFFH